MSGLTLGGDESGAGPGTAQPCLLAVVRPGETATCLSPGGQAFLAGPGRQLAAYALAFAGCGARPVRFYWQAPGRHWLLVRLDEASPDPAAGVLLTAERVCLPDRLTPRELDVLTLMAGGLSNTEIARSLVASIRTISTHVEHILAKLGQPSRTGAASMAVDRGYLRLPVPGGGRLPEGLTIGLLHSRVEAPAASAGPPAAPPAAGTAPAGGPGRGAGPGGAGRPEERAAGLPGFRPWPLAAVPAWPLARRPLRIGSAFPLSGPAAADGQEMAHGSALAVSEINARGGVGGRLVEQVVVDVDIFSADGVRQGFEELFAADVDAVTSGYLFQEDLARDLAADYGAPYVHAMTSQSQAQTVRDNHGRYQNFFQVCPTEVHYAPGFVRFLNTVRAQGWRPAGAQLAFVEIPLPSEQMVNPLAVGLAERSGWEIAGVRTVPAMGADWPAVVAELERLGPAAVMIAHVFACELAAFQRLAAQRLPHTLIYAVYAPSVPEFLRLAGAAAEGMVWSTVTGTYHDLIGQRFRRDYARAFGSAPGWSHAGIAYDEVHLLAMAWMSAADPRDRAETCRHLRRVRHRGVNGAYYLDNAEQSGLGFPDVTPDPSLGLAHLVFQVQDGAHRIISPAPYAGHRFRPPRPAR